ncbi:photosynthetic reaction center cytochrome PufC [Sphingomonas sp. AR_OL41]|jgi:photosynthetic reaction center cytochrome c subunit|uniref:photosynthetic reaction center cytochrome PufC n=1 Tax=Sphingomonas sp. AR_OL41 TaxID=3042729 RepID=UPI0024816AF1|nr:photosynthetic reaction center cytochrome PufC [Sphingomonas sp. AR_OL41]MDH7975168.1 photosynthetic reaction center cytochrome PufC [Sphingomonas sp. AR_OL41]
MSGLARNTTLAAIGGLAALSLGGCEVGKKQSTQTGFRGSGMEQIVDLSHVAKQAVIPAAAYELPADGGPTAAASYQNVKVLGGVSKDRFDHVMAQISQWVAPPAEGCNYCHNPENMASDEKYTKVVARRMLQMTLNINGKWANHVKATGVTCYTCHRGNAVPQYKWALDQGTPDPRSIVGNHRGQNSPNETVAYAALPYDPFDSYLRGTAQIRVAGKTALHQPGMAGASIKDAEATYGLMMHLSKALGVNCTFCHNTQSLGAWAESRPQRVTAYYGIRMVRDINDEYITSLAGVFPAYRKGPQGDPYKVNCLTCHQGLNKPLGGVSMLKDNPALKPIAVVAPSAAQAAATATVQSQLAAPAAANKPPAPAASPTPKTP